MTIRVPYWLLRLLFGRKLDRLQRRAALTGSASSSSKRGPFEAVITATETPRK